MSLHHALGSWIYCMIIINISKTNSSIILWDDPMENLNSWTDNDASIIQTTECPDWPCGQLSSLRPYMTHNPTATTDYNVINLSYWIRVTALLGPGDFTFVEYSINNNPFHNLRTYNHTPIAQNDAIQLPSECGDVSNLRIRFRTNVQHSTDFIYFDNIRLSAEINDPTKTPSKSPTVTTYNPSKTPTTLIPTITVLSTSNPTTAVPTTETPTTARPSTPPPTPDQAVNNVTIQIDGDTTDLEQENIIAIITKSLNISSDDIISTKIHDGSIIILISIPSYVQLSEDKIKTNVQEGLIQEYGDDLDISVTVSQTDNKETENTEHSLSVILVIVMVVLIIICCILLIVFCGKKKKENKLIQKHMNEEEINVNEGRSLPRQIPPGTIIAATALNEDSNEYSNDKQIEYNMDCHDDIEIIGTDQETIGAQHGEGADRIDTNKTNRIYGDDANMYLNVTKEINKTKEIENNVENDEIVIGDDEITEGMDHNNI